MSSSPLWILFTCSWAWPGPMVVDVTDDKITTRKFLICRGMAAFRVIHQCNVECSAHSHARRIQIEVEIHIFQRDKVQEPIMNRSRVHRRNRNRLLTRLVHKGRHCISCSHGLRTLSSASDRKPSWPIHNEPIQPISTCCSHIFWCRFKFVV